MSPRAKAWAETLEPDAVCRIYARLRAPSREHADRVIDAWRALPDDERHDATERMRMELIKMARRASGPW